MPVSFAELNKRDRSNVKGKTSGFDGVEGSAKSGMSGSQMLAAGTALAGAIGGGGGDSSGGSTSASGGAMKGAAAGAMAGAAFGPYGAAIGGVVGGVTGALSAKSNKKKAQAAAEAEKHQALAGIAMEKGQRVNQALNSMAQAFGSTLKQNKFLGRF